MRKKSTLSLLYAGLTENEGWGQQILSDALKWRPVQDEHMFRERPLELLTAPPSPELASRLSSMEFMLGVTRDEGTLFSNLAEGFGLVRNGAFLLLKGPQSFMQFIRQSHDRDILDAIATELDPSVVINNDIRRLINAVLTMFDRDTDLTIDILRHYPFGSTHSHNMHTLGAILTDYMFKCPNRKLAQDLSQKSSRVYMYHLVQQPTYAKALFGSDISHSLDVPLFFQYFPVLGEEDRPLASMYTDYFSAFAMGDINATSSPMSFYAATQLKSMTELPGWPEFEMVKKSVMTFGLTPHGAGVVEDINIELCNFWDGVRRRGQPAAPYPF
jgi:hypothetical protein